MGEETKTNIGAGIADAIHNGLTDLRIRMTSMEGVMGQIAEALTRLAILEERHAAVVTVVNKVSDKMDRSDSRVNELENDVIRIKTTASVLSKATTAAWAVLGTGILVFITKLFHMAFFN